MHVGGMVVVEDVVEDEVVFEPPTPVPPVLPPLAAEPPVDVELGH